MIHKILCRSLHSAGGEWCGLVSTRPAWMHTAACGRASSGPLVFSCISSGPSHLTKDAHKLLQPLFCKYACSLETFLGKRQRRSYRSEKFFRPFDVDTNVPHDTVIYTYRNDNLFRVMSIFGVVMIVFWSQLAWFMHGIFAQMKDERAQKMFMGDTWHGKVNAVMAKYKNPISVMCLALGESHCQTQVTFS